MRLTLEQARKRRKLRPEALGEKAKVSRATIYRLEAGSITNPTLDTVTRLEQALGLKRGTLVFGEQVEARAS